MLTHPKRALMTAFLALATLAVLVGPNLPILQAQSNDKAEIRRKFRRVIKLFETGQKAEAGKLLDEVLQKLSQNPDRELIIELRNEAGYAFFVEAMATKIGKGASEDDKIALSRLKKGAEKFLKLATIEEKRQQTNVGKIRRLVQKLATARHSERYYIMEVISSQVGQYLFTLPEIPTILGDQSNRLQIPMIILLTRMGEHSVRPLIELLDSSDGLVRQNAAAILGNIRDRRAIPALARLAQNDRESKVKETAQKALEKMLGKTTIRPAKEYYLALSEKYYFNDPFYTRNPYKEAVIWKWEDGKLQHWQVPNLLFNEVLAEEALFDALAVDQDYNEAWTLLLDVYFAQINEVRGSLRVALDMESKGRLASSKRSSLDILRNAARSLRMVNVVTSSRGRVQLYRALKRALDDKRPEIAVSCIETLRDLEVDGKLLPTGGSSSTSKSGAKKRSVKTSTSSGSSEGAPLIEALSFEDKRVRYAAAEALAHLNPSANFTDSNKVVQVLSNAISERAPRTVLVVAKDPQVQNSFRQQLRALNYDPFIVDTGRKGIFRALSVPTWDLIIISDYLPKVRAYEMINRLKRDYRTKHIPIFVMAKARSKPRAEIKYQGRANKVISIQITQNYLKEVLGNLFSTDEYKADVKGRTVQIAKKGAEALASIPVDKTNLQPKKALDALRKTLGEQPDEVRIPAMQALANLQDPAAMSDLIKVFKNRNNKVKTRVAACYAMGEILKTMPEINQEAYLALKAALQESQYKINYAAAQAFGKVPLTPKRYLELFNLRAEGDSGPYLFRHMVRLKSSR